MNQLVETILGVVGSLLLSAAIAAAVAASSSRRKGRKIVYATISALLIAIIVFVAFQVFLPQTLKVSAVAPVSSSQTVYFTQYSPDFAANIQHDLVALRVRDGATRFSYTYPLAATNTALNIALISNGVIYIEELGYSKTIQTAVLKALRAHDGSEIWHRTLTSVPNSVGGELPLSHPIIMDGVIYVDSINSSSREFIDALKVSDGSVLWQQPMPDQNTFIDASLTYANGIVYLAVPSNIYALRASDGNILWQSSSLHADIIRSSVVAGIVYASDTQRVLYALRGDTGARLWQIPDVTNFVAVDGIVYAGLLSGAFAALRASDGKLLWQVTGVYVDRLSPRSIQVVNDVVYASVGDHSAATTTDTTSIAAFRATDGAVLWSHADNVRWFLISAGLVYYSGINANRLTALQAQDGSVRWRYATSAVNTTFNTPSIVDGVLLVDSYETRRLGTFDESLGTYLTTLNARTGALYWRDTISVSGLVIADVA